MSAAPSPSPPPSSSSALLPEAAVLLHVGLPKTGTTALQSALAAARGDLRSAGVLYPGDTVNHREAVLALLGRRNGWDDTDPVPPHRVWSALVAEIRRARAPRAVVSHEFGCEATPDQIATLRDELGPGLHVVLTLRPFAALLGSGWQQGIKSGRRKSFDRWLEQILVGSPQRPADTDGFYRHHDQGAIVSKFVDVLGPEHVTVIVVDKAAPTLITDAFEDLLGLPRGLLDRPDADAAAANRGLSVAEVELVRALNAVVRRHDVGYADYGRLVRRGAVRRLQQHRVPEPSESRLDLPAWAVDPARDRAERYVGQIEASGCRVLGDLGALTVAEGIRTRPLRRPATVPFDVAVELVAGTLSAALGEGSQFDVAEVRTGSRRQRLARSERGRRLLAASDLTRSVSTGDLASVLAGRLVRRLRRG